MSTLSLAQEPYRGFYFYHFLLQVGMALDIDVFEEDVVKCLENHPKYNDWLQKVASEDGTEEYVVTIADYCNAAQGIVTPEMAAFLEVLLKASGQQDHTVLLTSMHSGSSDYLKVSDAKDMLAFYHKQPHE